MTTTPTGHFDCEYVVVGSGAGGGTLAARLASAGYRVMLLEAGGDPRLLVGGDPQDPHGNRLPDDYDVPAFHAFASENEAMKWDFFVRHYSDQSTQRRDPKYYETLNGKRVDGVLYPRAGTLGGCTAHNAMFFVSPANEDWDRIAESTGDRSWSAESMHRYFVRTENCHHRPLYRLLHWLGIDPTRHGWNGWLDIEKAIPKTALCDSALLRVLGDSVDAAEGMLPSRLKRLKWFFEGLTDPNDWRLIKDRATGVRYTPLSTRNHQRVGTRERVLETAQRFPDRLRVELNSLATRVIFDAQKRAIGVEYMKGERLYRAHTEPLAEHGERCEVRASREVILCGGAFNTPQLLMLSGVGPPDVLQSFGIEVRVPLPGVGRNLQDRYEIGVVNRMNFNAWEVLEGAKFDRSDPHYRAWSALRKGVYATNGSVLSVIKRSAPQRPLPDLYFFALLGKFKGYYPGYSELFPKHLNYLTWSILKAYTNNRAGWVTLRSPDPRDTPLVNFRYFEEGTVDGGEDLASLLDGVKFARSMTAVLKQQGLIAEEELPGEGVQSKDDLCDFIRDHAWGHHASCTCQIGPADDNGVLSSDFRVHGTQALRVVDASVFPRIPGFFLVCAVYMIAEKAADVILAAARGNA